MIAGAITADSIVKAMTRDLTPEASYRRDPKGANLLKRYLGKLERLGELSSSAVVFRQLCEGRVRMWLL